MKKKVAIFTSAYNNIYSGVGMYARMLVDLLLEKGEEVIIVSPDCDDSSKNFIKVKKFAYSLTPNSWLELSFQFNRILKDIHKDIKIVHFLDAREALFAKRYKDVFIIGSVHDTYSFDLQSQAILKQYFLDWRKRLLYYTTLYRLEKKAYKKLNLILSNTEYVKGRLVDFYELDASKVHTVYLPAPVEMVDEKKVRYRVNPPFTISFIGGNFQRKGLLQLIKAVHILKKDGFEVYLKVAGRDKNLSLIKKWIKNQKLEGIVEFLGHLGRKEIEQLLEKTDVFVMPSITEAFGLVYLEAMAYGIPVVGSKEGGVREIIEDNVNGYLCNPFVPDNIAENIKKALNTSNREKIIKNGFKTLSRFSKKTFLEKMLQIYNLAEDKF
jgi:glycosyltransferase involved in cell wall biosynthesis